MTWRVLCFLIGFAACSRAATNIDVSPAAENEAIDNNTGAPIKLAWPLIDPIKEAEILKMMDSMKVKERMEKLKQGMLDRLKARKPGVPQEIWDRVAKDMDVDALFQRQIAIYDKHFTLDDLKAVNAFYATPAGQRYLSLTPAFNMDIEATNKAWLQQAIVKVGLDLQDAAEVIPPSTNSAPVTSPATNSAPAQPSAPAKTLPFHPAPASHEA